MIKLEDRVTHKQKLNDHQRACTQFKVPIEDNQYAYLTVLYHSPVLDDVFDQLRGIVIIDAGAFLKLCKQDPANTFIRANDKDKETNYFFAENDFSAIVPTVDYTPAANGDREHISVANGIEIIHWMLSKNCTSFPVECKVMMGEKHRKEGGHHLQKYAIRGELLNLNSFKKLQSL
jgi:hypothetical protein